MLLRDDGRHAMLRVAGAIRRLPMVLRGCGFARVDRDVASAYRGQAAIAFLGGPYPQRSLSYDAGVWPGCHAGRHISGGNGGGGRWRTGLRGRRGSRRRGDYLVAFDDNEVIGTSNRGIYGRLWGTRAYLPPTLRNSP